MKSLYEYLNPVNESRFVKYDGRRHITGVDFSGLSNDGDNNILTEIDILNLDLMIQPEDDAFGRQWMNIYWDECMIEFHMPDIQSGSSWDLKIKINKRLMGEFLSKGYKWVHHDFAIQNLPQELKNRGIDVGDYKDQVGQICALVMNRQPEPLW